MNDLWRLLHYVNVSTANKAMPRRLHTVLDIISWPCERRELPQLFSKKSFSNQDVVYVLTMTCHLSEKSGNDSVNMAEKSA